MSGEPEPSMLSHLDETLLHQTLGSPAHREPFRGDRLVQDYGQPFFTPAFLAVNL